MLIQVCQLVLGRKKEGVWRVGEREGGKGGREGKEERRGGRKEGNCSQKFTHVTPEAACYYLCFFCCFYPSRWSLSTVHWRLRTLQGSLKPNSTWKYCEDQKEDNMNFKQSCYSKRQLLFSVPAQTLNLIGNEVYICRFGSWNILIWYKRFCQTWSLRCLLL